ELAERARLADARLTEQDEGGPGVRKAGEELVETRQLGGASHQCRHPSLPPVEPRESLLWWERSDQARLSHRASTGSRPARAASARPAQCAAPSSSSRPTSGVLVMRAR